MNQQIEKSTDRVNQQIEKSTDQEINRSSEPTDRVNQQIEKSTDRVNQTNNLIRNLNENRLKD